MNLYRWVLLFALAAILAGCITTPDEVVMAPIHVALTTDNTAEVIRIADDRKQLSELNEYGETPLLYAVKRRKVDLVKILLQKGADPDASNPRSGETPLIAAVRNGDTPMVRKLLDAGANLEVADNEGTTPLKWAVRKGDLQLVKILSLETGTGKVKEYPSLVLEAASYGHTETLAYLLTIGGSIETRSARKETPLIRAARFGHTDVVRLLLDKGANVNATDNNEASALSWAARMGRGEIVPELSKAGGTIDRLDSTGLTPLSHAVRLGHEQVVNYLLEKGADIKVNTADGEGLMYWASFQEGIARELHKYGTVPKQVAEDSDKPILIALRYLWLGKFYESELRNETREDASAVKNMVNCYQWAADFFDMAAAVNDEAVKALRKKQAAADRMALFLSALSVANAQMQAQMQANRMAEIGALGNPGGTATGYGAATYYTPTAFKKTHTGGIPGYQEAAAKCRQSAEGCRKVLDCYRSGDPLSESSRRCAEEERSSIQHLK